MRKRAEFLMAAGLSACAGATDWQPVNLAGPARATGEVASECVRNELRDMGYEVSGGAAAATSITGNRRNDPPWYLRLLPGSVRPSLDQINVRIDQGQLSVTAYSTFNLADPRPEPGQVASEEARANAQQILEACGRR